MNNFILFTYNISKLSQKNKMKFIRKLSGYDTIKQNKVQHKHGLLYEIHGFKFGSNTIVIPEKNKQIITDLFKEFNINIKSLSIKI